MPSIRFGADRVAADPGLLGDARRLALLTNDAARCATDAQRRSRAALVAAGVPIVRLFSPEHGLHGSAPDGSAVSDGVDALTGLPVISVYGEQLSPTPAALADIDAVLFDVPDIGVRYYTYAWTLTHLIDVCADTRIPLWVLDRPNPLSGALATVEGPILDQTHASFLGRHSIPIRHALTLGELARLWRAERRPDADVRVIACQGWQREHLWPRTGLPFVATSPAITSFDAALLYAGTCLFEATNLSVGRGTALSFQLAGAPWFDADAVIDRFAARALPGVMPEPAEFTPTSGPHAKLACQGVRLFVLDPAQVRPVSAGLALLADIATVHAQRFQWASYPTAVNPAGTGHFERLVGSSDVRALLEQAPHTVDHTTLARWVATPGWAARWRSALIYELSPLPR